MIRYSFAMQTDDAKQHPAFEEGGLRSVWLNYYYDYVENE